MNNSFFQKSLGWIYDNFKSNTATMLVVTGSVGWLLSAAGQVGAILFNSKIKKEQKGYLFPQAICDGIINIVSFIFISYIAKKYISKLASTGKFAPEKVRKFLNERPEYRDKVGKLSLDLDQILEKEGDKFPKESYYNYKNYITTVGTVGGSILASNIITPILRNSIATKVQHKYLNNRPQTSGNMKI